MSAGRADDANMRVEATQREISDAESVSGDEMREPRRRNSPSDPTSREIEDHTQTGHASFRSWCAACLHRRGRAEKHQPQGRKELDDGCWYRTNKAEVEQRGDSPVLAMHGGVTKSVSVHLIPTKGVDFPSCEKVVKMIFRKSFGQFVIPQSGVSVSERSILTLLRAVKLVWSGDVVQETSAQGDPQSGGAAESSVNVVKRHIRSSKLAVESASGVEEPADHDLLTWLAPYATSMHRRFSVGRGGKTACERSVGKRAVPPLAQFGARVWWMPVQPSNRRLGPLDSRLEQGRYLGPMDGSYTVRRSTRQRISNKCTGRRWRWSLDQSSCVTTM